MNKIISRSESTALLLSNIRTSPNLSLLLFQRTYEDAESQESSPQTVGENKYESVPLNISGRARCNIYFSESGTIKNAYETIYCLCARYFLSIHTYVCTMEWKCIFYVRTFFEDTTRIREAITLAEIWYDIQTNIKKLQVFRCKDHVWWWCDWRNKRCETNI